MEERVDGGVVYNTGTGCIKVMRNPEIFLPAEVFGTPYASNMKFVGLPELSDFEVIDGVKAPNAFSSDAVFAGASYRMMVPNDATQCPALTNDFTNLLGFTSHGKQLHYAGHATIHENTIENPAPDGGASVLPFHKVPGTQQIMQCSTAPMDFINIDHCRLSTSAACESSSFFYTPLLDPVVKENVVLCGSPGEVANDPTLDASKTNMFRMHGTGKSIFASLVTRQKTNVWAMVAMEAPDQLRQRVAWALAQLLVITPEQVSICAYSWVISFRIY